jgi:RNA polymerase sigma factor (sigma-70 family)
VTSLTLESDVVRAAEGDEGAYRRVIEECASTVCSIALAIVRNVEASEDIAQEVFLAIWTNLRKLRSASSFLPWVRQVARNQAHLWLREHRREVADDVALAAAVDARPTPADSLLEDEERRILGEVLDQLPDEAREVVILFYREGSSTRQVAELLGISEDAVRQRLSRTRSRIREEVLQRFGRTIARTAPGAAFVTVIAGALTGAAAPASAAVTMSAAAGAGTKLGAAAMAVAKGTLFGGILGVIGIVMGMQHLEPIFDEQEAEELRRFRNLAIAVMLAGTLATSFAVSLPRPRIPGLVAYLGLAAALAFLYAVRLPKILGRRMAWEREINPDAARQTRRQWLYATIAQAASASLGGAVLMSFAVREWLGK